VIWNIKDTHYIRMNLCEKKYWIILRGEIEWDKGEKERRVIGLISEYTPKGNAISPS